MVALLSWIALPTCAKTLGLSYIAVSEGFGAIFTVIVATVREVKNLALDIAVIFTGTGRIGSSAVFFIAGIACAFPPIPRRHQICLSP